ncbi:hypothetical protein [Streptomyces sp. BSE7-9]|uniref:hypothetical protein n=1 Tax=Streptomyces sp. BSE7-9 TaxID=2759948 RepID=UPI0018EEBF13|nr:hypothetical protein [Streptomyces sp. BSE7-9]
MAPLDPGTRLSSGPEDFLSAGPGPVLIGFGSMASGEGEQLSAIAVRAPRRSGLLVPAPVRPSPS